MTDKEKKSILKTIEIIKKTEKDKNTKTDIMIYLYELLNKDI